VLLVTSKAGHQRQRFVDQIRHQDRLGLRVAPVDVWLARYRVVAPGTRSITDCAPGTSRATFRIAATSCRPIGPTVWRSARNLHRSDQGPMIRAG
jgi:hypothetical protein